MSRKTKTNPAEEEARPRGKKRRFGLSRRERAERFATSFYMFPSLAGVLTFFILPFFVVIYYSLIDDTSSGIFVGIDNFTRLFENSAFKLALRNTGLFSVTAVPLVVVLALALAVLLDANVPYKSTFRTIFLSPMIVPAASVILIWQVLFDFNGVVNSAISFFGGDPVEWLKSDYGYLVVVMLFLWKNIGYNMIMFMSALSNIPRDIIEVAMLDGCGPVRRFFSIKLRYLSSTISFVTIMSLINSFKVFREVYLLTGDYPFETMYTLQHFMNNTFANYEYQKLSSAAVVLCLIMIVIIGLLLFIDDRAGRGLDE
ncbi:MAG: sugar ABC transporter permease [Clostridia bacterium]|nr:sugar ABC transporter permease [Clostridia bacterium]MBQ3955029.1 sugar ABC transporter permease [Clostridia bacterium]MBQ5354406.1 sugar ABC transporter permease [Clostridia bacterium]